MYYPEGIQWYRYNGEKDELYRCKGTLFTSLSIQFFHPSCTITDTGLDIEFLPEKQLLREPHPQTPIPLPNAGTAVSHPLGTYRKHAWGLVGPRFRTCPVHPPCERVHLNLASAHPN